MTSIGWGTKIAILYGGFVLLIVFMVIMSVNQKVDLVSENYYDQEVAYQGRINEMNNANTLSEKVTTAFINNGIEITFPEEMKGKIVTGNVLFFRPSDKTKDFTLPVKLDDNAAQFVAGSNLQKGMYKLQIDWKADNKNYYSEQVVVIP
jgi:hypothetical protein